MPTGVVQRSCLHAGGGKSAESAAITRAPDARCIALHASPV
jgi:hypothetical protein